ncbi:MULTISPECIES: eCIS core domain-containing protein [unclassified Micromonospora]|uniref:eCIS core domain-containing protein n=1 Tax=unclassified Micromonospora TaxID=2617518 RepID=UPI002FEE9278
MRQLSQAVRPALQGRPSVPAARSARPAESSAPRSSFVPSTQAPSALTRSGRPLPAPLPSALAQPGRPLPGPLLTEMERGFGQNLGHVRVHDGESAHLAAARLDSRAFSFGNHLTFARGEYRPDTPEGRGLLAHEIAHALQGGAPDDARAEAEADEAARALAAGRRPTVTRRPGPPRIHRATSTAAPPPPVPAPTPASAPGPASAPQTAPNQPATAAGPALRLPPGLEKVTDVPDGLGTTELVVKATSFTLPLEKGAGTWVQVAYDDAAAGGRLVFTPIIEGSSVAAYKEGKEDYKSIWLGRFGFPTTKAVSEAFIASKNDKVKQSLADPAVKAVVVGLGTDLRAAKCDIDHIVEKQMGGTSIPSNLQLLTSTKNQAAGAQTYQGLVEIVKQIRDPSMRGPNVRRLQIQIAKATVPAGTPDPSSVIENHLREGHVAGSDAVKAKAAGKPVALSAGGQGETVSVRDTGSTLLDGMSKRIVPGMRLTEYKRGAGGASSTRDTVEGELDSRAVATTGAASTIRLSAELAPPAAGTPAAAPQPAAEADPAASPPGEARVLKIDKEKNTKIAFYYPYLSPGTLTKVALDEQGNLTGEGTIKSSVPFLGTLNVLYSKDELRLVAPIPAEKLVSPLPGAFRFTGGQLALQLSPELVPDGQLSFSIGPAAKPVMLGDLTVTMAGGALVATGTLTPGGKIPGVTAAAGVVAWNSETGWSGKITATSSSIPRSTANVEIGFAMTGGKFDPYASGGIDTQVRGTALHLGARWDGQGLSYHGSVVVPKPLPLVDSVKLSGRFTDRGMWLEGDAAILWKSISSTMHVGYSRKAEDEEGRFSGSATIKVKTEKAEGSLSLTFDEEGRYWGKGTIGYQVTKDLRPVLGVEVTKDQRVKVSGEVAVGDIALTKVWPSPEGGKIPISKGLGVKFSIPTPVPAVTAYGEIRGSLGLGYGVGPVILKGVVFKGELYPLEDDPQVKAKLTGALAMPAYGELYGTFGAYIGLEVALGAVGAKGGIDITPKLRISGEGGIKVDADYDSGGFSFSAEAYATGRLTASAAVDLVADLYAAWGVLEHTWTYQVGSVSAQIGPEIRLTLGKIAYAKNGELTWPSLSQIKVEPDSIDPLEVVKDMLRRGEAREK